MSTDFVMRTLYSNGFRSRYVEVNFEFFGQIIQAILHIKLSLCSDCSPHREGVLGDWRYSFQSNICLYL